MSAITAKQLVVTKGRKTILGPLDLRIESGAITGLIGPSGSGKTTLMRSIVGVQKFDGMLTVLDEKAGSKNLRKKIGYVTQAPAVYSDLTVEQNLRYFGMLIGASSKHIATTIRTVQLEAHAKQLVESLSGGQKARVSLAVALLGDPKLLVLDEPTVGLDPLLRNDLWGLFVELAESGKTLLVSSHVMDEAERCENLLLIREGQVLWNDTRDELLTHTNTSNVGDAFIASISRPKGEV